MTSIKRRVSTYAIGLRCVASVRCSTRIFPRQRHNSLIILQNKGLIHFPLQRNASSESRIDPTVIISALETDIRAVRVID